MLGDSSPASATSTRSRPARTKTRAARPGWKGATWEGREAGAGMGAPRRAGGSGSHARVTSTRTPSTEAMRRTASTASAQS